MHVLPQLDLPDVPPQRLPDTLIEHLSPPPHGPWPPPNKLDLLQIRSSELLVLCIWQHGREHPLPLLWQLLCFWNMASYLE